FEIEPLVSGLLDDPVSDRLYRDDNAGVLRDVRVVDRRSLIRLGPFGYARVEIEIGCGAQAAALGATQPRSRCAWSWPAHSNRARQPGQTTRSWRSPSSMAFEQSAAT